MNIRFAEEKDIGGIDALLYQVASVHAAGRPDLFIDGEKKYTDDELVRIITNERGTRPIFVYTDTDDTNGTERVRGYAFCMLEDHADAHVLTPIRTLYIDDLCVDEGCRNQHIGTALFEHAKAYAKSCGCYNLTLNVWACNENARKFYERMGMQVQKTGMESIL